MFLFILVVFWVKVLPTKMICINMYTHEYMCAKNFDGRINIYIDWSHHNYTWTQMMAEVLICQIAAPFAHFLQLLISLSLSLCLALACIFHPFEQAIYLFILYLIWFYILLFASSRKLFFTEFNYRKPMVRIIRYIIYCTFQ